MADQKGNKADCSFAKEALLEEIQDGEFGSKDFDLFLEKHAECKEEIKEFYDTWVSLDDASVPEPSSKMDALFYRSLSEYQPEEKSQASDISETPKLKVVSTNWKRLSRLAIAASIFLAGAITSFYIVNGNNDSDVYADKQPEQSAEISLVSTKSAVTRLEDISELKKASELSETIIDALNKALIMDPNINVRLSAIEAMVHFADNPKVRENLIKAIPYQDSPIIQITLAEVMIALEEKGSKDAWQELFDSGNLEGDVKAQLEETLEPVLKL